MSQQPLKVGILGSGLIATFSYGYLPTMSLIADKAVLVAICDPLVDRARGVAGRLNFSQVHSNLHEMLAHSDVELIVNLTPLSHRPSQSSDARAL